MKPSSNNTTLLLTSVFSLLFPAIISANEISETELQKQLGCIVSVEDAYDRLDIIMETWFTNDESNLNIKKNFHYINNLHTEYLKKVGIIKAKPFPDFKDDTAVGLELENIDRSYPDEMEQQNNLFIIEDRFLSGLSDIEGGLQEVGNEIEHGKKNCNHYFNNELNETQKIITSLQKQTSTTKQYISEAAKKRKDSLSIIIKNRRFSIIDHYNKETGKNLSKFSNILSDIEMASILFKNINKWWIEHNTPNIAHGTVTQYLQFNSALRGLNLYIGTLDNFEEQLKSLNNLPENVKNTILKDIYAYKFIIIKNIDYIKNLGYNGFINRQRFITESRLQHIDAYSKECGNLIKQYIQLSEENENQISFDKYDMLYWKQVKICEEIEEL
ncbi:hypothetical protein [Thiothrix unzii]|uniref:Uncharacterized protein n=1 Tax=Thiothrix unzii TaxID=111769 RepID=A0A975IHV5_9GAMM|nr:hypothetical protein [Thiothrix unzii]QTR54124.1 hypothetical protein J9260_03245 [Thiothrix unzii]